MIDDMIHTIDFVEMLEEVHAKPKIEANTTSRKHKVQLPADSIQPLPKKPKPYEKVPVQSELTESDSDYDRSAALRLVMQYDAEDLANGVPPHHAFAEDLANGVSLGVPPHHAFEGGFAQDASCDSDYGESERAPDEEGEDMKDGRDLPQFRRDTDQAFEVHGHGPMR